MLERISNTRSKFPTDARAYLSVHRPGIIFNAKASETMIGANRRVVLLFDHEHWQLGFAFLKMAKVPGSFADVKHTRHHPN